MAPKNRKGGGGKGGGGGQQSSSKPAASSSPIPLEYVAPGVAGVAAIVLLIWLVGPLPDTDRWSRRLNEVVPASQYASITSENGQAIAKALDLRQMMQDIVDNTPGASFVTEDPPIIHFVDFMTEQECDEMIEAGKPGLKASTGTGQLKNGQFERTKIDGRTSYNSWCMAPYDCPDDPTIRGIDSRISNTTGFSYKNMEYYQILRYAPKQEYQAHSDWIDLQAGQPSGPRVFTFFLYLNDVRVLPAAASPPVPAAAPPFVAQSSQPSQPERVLLTHTPLHPAAAD